MFLRACRCDISVFFVCQACDFLDSIIKADDLEFDGRVANQFTVGQCRSSRFSRLGSRFFSIGKTLRAYGKACRLSGCWSRYHGRARFRKRRGFFAGFRLDTYLGGCGSRELHGALQSFVIRSALSFVLSAIERKSIAPLSHNRAGRSTPRCFAFAGDHSSDLHERE